MGPSDVSRRVVVIIAASCLLLTGCGQSSPVDLGSIRAEVSSLPDPAGWVRDGGVNYACETINLDCTNTSSGLNFGTSVATTDACAALVTWVTSTPAFVGPSAAVRLTTWTTPTPDDCTSEMTKRGRYLIKATGRSRVSTSPGLGWQVLMTRGPTGPRLSVIFGDPPEQVLSNMGT